VLRLGLLGILEVEVRQPQERRDRRKDQRHQRLEVDRVGKPEHLLAAITDGKADAVLAASIFHFGTYRIREVKEYLAGHNVPVRL
jgi:hypothetical protein